MFVSFGLDPLGLAPEAKDFMAEACTILKSKGVDLPAQPIFINAQDFDFGNRVAFHKAHSGEHEATIAAMVRAPGMLDLIQLESPKLMRALAAGSEKPTTIAVLIYDNLGKHRSVGVARILATIMRSVMVAKVPRIRHINHANWPCPPNCLFCTARPKTGLKVDALKLAANLWTLR
jgi:hypothetical protein